MLGFYLNWMQFLCPREIHKMFLVLDTRLWFNIFAFVLSCLWVEQWGTVRSVCKVPMTVFLFLWVGGIDCGMWAVTCTVSNSLSNFLLASLFCHSSSRSPPHAGLWAEGQIGAWGVRALVVHAFFLFCLPKSNQWPILPVFLSLGLNVLGLALGKADWPVSFRRAL